MNKRLLKSFMMRFGDNGNDLAAALGIARTTLSAKMNGYNGYDFTQGEMTIIKNRYHLSAKDIDQIFFALEVS